MIHLIVVPLILLVSVLFLLPVVAAMLAAYIWDSEHPDRAQDDQLFEEHWVRSEPKHRLRKRLP